MSIEIKYLMEGLRDGSLTKDDWRRLDELLINDENKTAFLEAFQFQLESNLQGEEFDEQRFMPLLQQVLKADKPSPAKLKHMFGWRRLAVAASIIVIILSGGYFLINKTPTRDAEVAVKTPVDIEAPKQTKAVITLASGRQISLDSINIGALATEGTSVVSKTSGGTIVYEQDIETSGNELLYNTLSNPRGSKVIEMVLADGSHVWLNAGSSITYPVAFKGNKRMVTMAGEAYFEVVKNSDKPFTVKANNTLVEVLGTHFDVNSYSNELSIKTTLLEGSVRIVQGSKSKMLIPGQQAQVSDAIKVVNGVDIEEVMAWKQGLFVFNNADVDAITRQLSNWYDVDVRFVGAKKKETFSGIVERSGNISSVLKILQEAGIRYRLEGKKSIILY